MFNFFDAKDKKKGIQIIKRINYIITEIPGIQVTLYAPHTIYKIDD